MSVIDHSVMFKSKSGRHFWKSKNGDAEKEEKNRNRHDKRHKEFLKNRTMQSTPGKGSSDTVLKPRNAIQDMNKNQQKAYRDKFKLYLDKKANQKSKSTLKPFLSAVAKGRFVEQVAEKKKGIKNTARHSPINTRSKKLTPLIASNQEKKHISPLNIKAKRCADSVKTKTSNRNDPKIFTSTVIKPKNSFSALIPTKATKIFNESISPVEIREDSSPVKAEDTPTNYVSPYVTISRGGRTSARKEKEARNKKYSLESRKSLHLNQSIEERQKKEAATYFRLQVQREKDRLDSLAAHWRQYADEHDLVNVAIGQSRLLTTSKFKQLEQLIEQCENNEGENVVKPEDLEGFWSMVYIQVENCNQRFDRLKMLKNNGWEDPDLIATKEKKILKTRSMVSKKTTTSKKRLKSALSEMLKEARKNIKKENEVLSSSIQCHTPRKNTWIVEECSGKTPPRGILKTPGSVRTKRTTLTFKTSPQVKLFVD